MKVGGRYRVAYLHSHCPADSTNAPLQIPHSSFSGVIIGCNDRGNPTFMGGRGATDVSPIEARVEVGMVS